MSHKQIVQKTSRSGDRAYEIDGELLPSVTTILGTLNKPFLVPWAAKLEREYVVRAAAELEQQLPVNAPTMSIPAYEATLNSRLAKKKAHKVMTEERAAIGTSVHDAVEIQCRLDMWEAVEKLPDTSKVEIHNALENFKTWKDDCDFKPKMLEQIVYSKEYGYAGTMDWFGLTEIEVAFSKTVLDTVGDWKTGKALYSEQKLQVAAYAYAMVEMGHAEFPLRGAVVRVPWMKKEHPETLWMDQKDIDDAFVAFLGLKRAYEYFK